MCRSHMDFESTLLRKYLITLCTGILGKVSVFMIHNQTLLSCRYRLCTVSHPTTPDIIGNRKRKVCCTEHCHGVPESLVESDSIFSGSSASSESTGDVHAYCGRIQNVRKGFNSIEVS